MIKITNLNIPNKPQYCKNIDLGTVFTGFIGNLPLDIYIKHPDGIMSLSNTRNTWTGTPDLEVYNFREVNISITIE